MRLHKKGGALLLAVGIWNIVIWGNFAKNLAKTAADPEKVRPRPYYIAHAVLIVVNSVIGACLAAVGLKGVRAGSGA
jgi:hypothetical protein